MKDAECPVSLRGGQYSGTHGSPVGRRARLVDVDRESRATDHPPERDILLEPRDAADELATAQEAESLLTSASISFARQAAPHCRAWLGQLAFSTHSLACALLNQLDLRFALALNLVCVMFYLACVYLYLGC